MPFVRTLTTFLPLVLLALLLTACPAGSGPAPSLTVTITAPSGDVAVNGTLTLQVAVSGGTPDAVRLLRDDVLLVTLVAPYSFSWDTTTEPEASYELVAEADVGGASFQSDPLTVTVDRTPPTVTNRTPTPGEANVSARTTLVATFSEALLASTVTGGNVQLVSDVEGAIATTLELAADGRTLTITPDVVPAVPATVTLTFTNGVTDPAGNPLTPPGDTWAVPLPEWLELGDFLPAAPTIPPNLAVGPDDAVIVAASRNGGAGTEVDVRSWDGTAWQPLGGLLSANPGTASAFVTSAVFGLGGSPIVAWSEDDGTADAIYVRRWDGAAWLPLGKSLSAEAGATNAGSPSLATETDGTPLIAWTEFDGAASNVHVRRWNGSGWDPLGGALSANPGITGTVVPALAVGPDDVPVVAWRESDGTASHVYVRRWNGAGWDPLGTFLSARVAATDVFTFDLTVGGDGAPVVAWEEEESDGGAYEVHVRRWNGSGWDPLGGAISATPGTTSGFHTEVVIDGDGTPVIAWQESDGSTFKIHVRRWTGAVWEDVAAPVNAVGGGAQYPSLALDGNDAPLVAWQESAGATSNFVRRYNQ